MLKKRRFGSLKLLSALLMAVQQSLGRFILWASCHGISLPWLEWAEQAVLPSTLERYRRRAMISQLRVQRYRISRGPYFIRSNIEKASEIFRLIQFPLLLGSKVLLALLICLAPFFIFFVVRIYLPVEQRIAATEPRFDSNLFATSKAVIPVVVNLDAELATEHSQKKLEGSPTVVDGVQESGVLSHEVKIFQGLGTAHAELRGGWIIESSTEKLFRFGGVGEPVNLRFRYRPIPTDDSQLECKFQVSRSNNDIVFAGTFNAGSLSRQALVKSPLTRNLQEKLLPEFARNRVTIPSGLVSVGLNAGENALRLKIEPLSGPDQLESCKALVYGFEISGSKRIEKSIKDLRSLLLISFDSLHADLALNDSIMPWLTGFLTSPQTIHFAQHHALNVRKGESLRTLLGLPELNGLQNDSPSQSSILKKLRQTGYRVVLVGNFKHMDSLIREIEPDILVRIENETYEPSLVLSELKHVLEEEGRTPLLVVMRLSGMNSPWRPFASDINLRTSALHGGLQATSETLVRSHLKSLDRVLAKNLSALESQGLFEKMDIAITAERGFDLGLNRSARDKIPTRSPELILNQETLRVPLGVSLAKSSKSELHHLLKTQYYLTTHHDLARTLWENMGVFDAKFAPNTVRLWKKDDFFSDHRSTLRFSSRKTEEEVRKLAIKSKIQDGVIFSDPASAGGFLKYVSQANPTRVRVSKVTGWREQVAVEVDAGERFFQVSQRGRREEVVSRVNSQFLREARRVLRQERRLPLRYRFTAHIEQQIELKLKEQAAEESRIEAVLPKELRWQTKRLSSGLLEHQITGVARDGDTFELRGNGGTLTLAENSGEGLLVACSEAFHFTMEALNDALSQKALCLLDTPASDRLESFRVLNKKTLSFWLAEDEEQPCSTDNSLPNKHEVHRDCKAGPEATTARF